MDLFQMDLFMGVASLCLAALFFSVLLIGCRKPKPSRWAGNFLVDIIYVPVTVGLLALGGCFVGEALVKSGGAVSGWPETLISVGAVLFTVLILYMMKIRKRLARFSALEAEAAQKASVLAFSPSAAERDTEKPAPSRPKRLAA